MSRAREVFLGIDVGTQGVRVVALDEAGELVASARRPFALAEQQEEQSPEEWWSAILAALRAVGAELRKDERLTPVALSVTSTSGTVIPLDAAHRPLHSALMYSDKRSVAEVARVRRIAPALGCNTSWGLPKLLWFCANHPDTAAAVHSWRHAGDFILGRLTGVWGVTDVTNALKTGYDPVAERWPDFLAAELGVRADWLPRVVHSGVVLGPLAAEVAAETGLPGSIVATTGMTDGCASQVASGAARPGDWNTTIGTTLVVKGVTRRRIEDPLGRIYNHRHPDGYWMPGGASNTGAEWISRDYAGQDLDGLEASARPLIPTGQIAYPLRQHGERFPFVSAAARGFDPDGVDGPALYAARLEGVAYLERLALDLLGRLSGEPVGSIFTAGGGSRSELWLEIRSNVLRKPIHRARHGEGAVGAAIVAAAGTRYGGLVQAAAALTHVATTVAPTRLADAYEDGYRRFREALVARGYLRRDERA